MTNYYWGHEVRGADLPRWLSNRTRIRKDIPMQHVERCVRLERDRRYSYGCTNGVMLLRVSVDKHHHTEAWLFVGYDLSFEDVYLECLEREKHEDVNQL